MKQDEKCDEAGRRRKNCRAGCRGEAVATSKFEAECSGFAGATEPQPRTGRMDAVEGGAEEGEQRQGMDEGWAAARI